MNTYKFSLDDEDSLIIVEGKLGNNTLALALDTSASHTVIDLSTLLLAGYKIENAVNSVHLETGKGSIEALVFKIKSIQVLGKTIENMEICSYDFFLNNVLVDIHGVLGLDFFRDTDLSISFKRFEIIID